MSREEEYNIIKLYYQIARQLGRRDGSESSGQNMYVGQYRCLQHLDMAEQVSQRELCDLMDVRAASLSEILSKLEKKKFIRREPSAEDRRTFSISITQKGHEEMERAKRLAVERRHDLVAPLSEDEKSQFYRILKKIRDYCAKSRENI